MKKAIVIIPYRNGQPDLTTEEWEEVEEKGISFANIGGKEYFDQNKCKAAITAPQEVIDRIKSPEGQARGFEWVEDVESEEGSGEL